MFDWQIVAASLLLGFLKSDGYFGEANVLGTYKGVQR
jgi:hypothetical protein